MNDITASTRGLGPIVGSLAFALGSLLALYGGTEFAAHVYRHAVAFDRLVFDDVFIPGLLFLVGAFVAFGAFVGALRRVLES